MAGLTTIEPWVFLIGIPLALGARVSDGGQHVSVLQLPSAHAHVALTEVCLRWRLQSFRWCNVLVQERRRLRANRQITCARHGTEFLSATAHSPQQWPPCLHLLHPKAKRCEGMESPAATKLSTYEKLPMGVLDSPWLHKIALLDEHNFARNLNAGFFAMFGLGVAQLPVAGRHALHTTNIGGNAKHGRLSADKPCSASAFHTDLAHGGCSLCSVSILRTQSLAAGFNKEDRTAFAPR
jgi:hypothetical protein